MENQIDNLIRCQMETYIGVYSVQGLFAFASRGKEGVNIWGAVKEFKLS